MITGPALKPLLNIEHHLFPPGYEIDFVAELEIQPASLGYVVDFILNQMLPPEFFAGSAVIDMKGRGKYGEMRESPTEKLLYLRGEACFEDNGGEALASAEQETQTFSLCLLTKFKEFVGAKQISHDLQIIKSGTIFDTLNIKELGRATGLRFQELWLGIDIFTGTFFGSYFGFTPVVRDSFLLQASEAHMSLEINAEALKKREELPFERQALLRKLPELVHEASGEDLRMLYRSALDGA